MSIFRERPPERFDGDFTVRGPLHVRPEEWGAVAYDDRYQLPPVATRVSSAAALQSAVRSFGRTGTVNASKTEGNTIVLAPGVYYLDATLVLDAGVRLQGSGRANTHLVFAPGIRGIWCPHHTQTQDGGSGRDALISDLSLWGADPSLSSQQPPVFVGDAEGVRLDTRASLVRVGVYRFAGHGVFVRGVLGETPATEASDCVLYDVHTSRNGGHGIYTYGADANIAEVTKCKAEVNGQDGFHDASLLGCVWTNCHAIYNNGRDYAQTSAAASATYLACYVEGDPPKVGAIEMLGQRTTVVGGTLAIWTTERTDVDTVGSRSGHIRARHGDSTVSLPGSDTMIAMTSTRYTGEVQAKLRDRDTMTTWDTGDIGDRSVMGWTSDRDAVREPDQMLVLKSIADTSHLATERKTATLAPGTRTTLIFRGGEAQTIGVGVAFAHPNGDYVAVLDVRSDVEGVRVVRRWHEAARYRVEVENAGTATASVEVIGLFLSRTRYKP